MSGFKISSTFPISIQKRISIQKNGSFHNVYFTLLERLVLGSRLTCFSGGVFFFKKRVKSIA